MARDITTLHAFLLSVDDLLKVALIARRVLLPGHVRRDAARAIQEARVRLESLLGSVADRQFAEGNSNLEAAGLTGAQLAFKLKSYRISVEKFDELGGIEEYEDAMDKAGKLLQSIAGAIPGFGSFLQELIEFLIRELSKRRS